MGWECKLVHVFSQVGIGNQTSKSSGNLIHCYSRHLLLVCFLTLQLIRYLRVYEPDSGFKVTSSNRYSQDKEGAGAKLVVTKKWYVYVLYIPSEYEINHIHEYVSAVFYPLVLCLTNLSFRSLSYKIKTLQGYA